MSDDTTCGNSNDFGGKLHLRVGSIFVILVTSLAGTLFPIAFDRFRGGKFSVPALSDFAKFFGSGVIIATAFIHLLAPAYDELNSDCLHGAWKTYPWASAISMTSVFGLFILELLAHRLGHAIAGNLAYDAHDHAHAAHGPESQGVQHAHDVVSEPDLKRIESGEPDQQKADAGLPVAQLVGVGILEFGVVFHSIIIGITLGALDSQEFTTLFIVIIFHQMFEGLGLGTRLAALPLRPAHPIPYLGGIIYSFVTPLGIAIGLGIRNSYNPDGGTENIVSGVLDAISSGILLYTGLVELLAHEFIFNESMRRASTGKVVYALTCVIAGAGIMALLGRWA